MFSVEGFKMEQKEVKGDRCSFKKIRDGDGKDNSMVCKVMISLSVWGRGLKPSSVAKRKRV